SGDRPPGRAPLTPRQSVPLPSSTSRDIATVRPPCPAGLAFALLRPSFDLATPDYQPGACLTCAGGTAPSGPFTPTARRPHQPSTCSITSGRFSTGSG